MDCKVKVNLDKNIDHSYTIHIGNGNFKKQLFSDLKRIAPTRLTVITDSNLSGLYQDDLKQTLDDCGIEYQILIFKAGESHKTMDTVIDLLGGLSRFQMDRKSLVIAFGGGVCGDMAGFVSSLFLRGIPFIQVPTSTLSMLDSSVGGKTGVDTVHGKNLVGAFHQPLSVIIDIRHLDTLDSLQFINGLAEVVKHALIQDPDFYRWLLENKDSILEKKDEELLYLIDISCRIKAHVVEQDEKEAGLRQILNLGHTFGHAIEHASDFKIPHGYSIALGFVAAAFLSIDKAGLSRQKYQDIIVILKEYGLLKYLDIFKTLDRNLIRQAASSDKKNVAGKVKVVLLSDIGVIKQQGSSFSFGIEEREFNQVLDELERLE